MQEHHNANRPVFRHERQINNRAHFLFFKDFFDLRRHRALRDIVNNDRLARVDGANKIGIARNRRGHVIQFPLLRADVVFVKRLKFLRVFFDEKEPRLPDVQQVNNALCADGQDSFQFNRRTDGLR